MLLFLLMWYLHGPHEYLKIGYATIYAYVLDLVYFITHNKTVFIKLHWDLFLPIIQKQN